MKKLLALILALSMILALLSGISFAAPEATDNFVDTQKSLLETPEKKYRLDLRWWMQEGHHTDQTLIDTLDMFSQWYGAAEFLALNTTGVNSGTSSGQQPPYYGWGSAEWNSDSQLIIKEATERGLGFSLTSGTHWGNANLPDTYEWDGQPYGPDNKAALKELDYTTRLVAPQESISGALTKPNLSSRPAITENILVAVLAYKQVRTGNFVVVGEATRPGVNTQIASNAQNTLDHSTMINLTDKVIESPGGVFSLDWTNNTDSPYEVIAFWMHGSGSTSSPSVSTNYCVNYFDPYGMEAVMAYWEEYILTDVMKPLLMENGRGEMYMDSMEISTFGQGGVYWGYTFLEEFESRRGYSLLPYLPYILKTGGNYRGAAWTYRYTMDGDNDLLLMKIRNDLYETFTDMYIENVLQPLKKWLNETLGMNLRAEVSYCMPFEMTTPGRWVDGIEGESLEFDTQRDFFRNMAGPAHLYGKTLSSETGAWTNLQYHMSLNHYNQIFYSQFAAGVSRTVVHGMTAIPGVDSGYQWPGTLGSSYPAKLDARQPYSIHFDDWALAMARYQAILRQGVPLMDIGILRTDYRFHNYAESLRRTNTIFDVAERNKSVYWGDETLQNNGYTYDYFSPMSLTYDEDIISFDPVNKVIVTDPQGNKGPAYKALLIYQDIMPLGSAKKILEWVEAGLPVVIADGGKELISGTMQGVNLWKTNAKAAAYSPFNDQNDPNDSELATVMNQLRNHKNVRVVDSQDKALEALRDLNVYPRADFDKENRNVITLMRDTDDTLYLYAYNFMYDHFDETQYYTTYDSNGDAIDEADYVHPEPYTITFAIEGLGKPYLINCWTNDITEIGEYEVKGGKTYVTLTLLPGEATFIALDKNNTNYLYVTDTDADRVIMSDGSMAIVATESGTYTTKLNNSSEITTVITVPDNISLPLWNLTVEDWNAGEKKTRTEDRPAGFQGPGTLAYTTTEVYFETTKTPIAVGETALVPWKDIPSVGPNVSGVGYYSTSFELPKNWADNNGAYLKIGSAHGNTVAVYVNGKKAPAVDLQNLTVEVTDLLQPGTNTLEAEVSSSLRNRLLQRGGLSGNLTLYRVPAPYGMTGDVELVTYTVAPIKSNVLASIRSDEANVGLGAPASYTVSLSEAMGAGVVTLSFTADSRFLDLNSATALNGFSIVDPLAWEYIGSQLWNGTVKLYCPGFVQSNDLLDILKISGVARDLLGDTTVTLTNITITGDMFGFSGDMQSLIVTAEAETSIVSKTVFSKYDLNHDGRIDELDLAIVVYYYLANDLEADWDVVKFDIASAKDCDVAVNGRVDLADMIEVIANYCDSY